MRAYLDYNATAPLRAEARSAMVAALDLVGNPSSVHAEGRAVRALMETAREQVAELVAAKPSEIVFTSSATEAANAVLNRSWRTILYARIEHACVLAPIERSAGRVIEIPVSRDGLIDVDVLAARLEACKDEIDRAPGQTLLAVQAANNETGVVQPLSKICELARTHKVAILCDAVQAAGRIPLDFRALGIDFLLLSAHKIGGPMGVGALVARDGADLAPIIMGGGQERRRRAGTENVPGIAGFGAAAAQARTEIPSMEVLRAKRDLVERGMARLTPQVVVIGAGAERLANTSCVAWPGKSAQTLLISLDLAGVAVSAGAACSSGKVGPSQTLMAMGIEPQLAASAIRISLGPATSARDLQMLLEAWVAIRGPRENDQARGHAVPGG